MTYSHLPLTKASGKSENTAPIWNRTICIDFGYDVNRKLTGAELFIKSYKILAVIYKK